MDKDPPIETLGKNTFWPLHQPLTWEEIDSFPEDLMISDRLDLATHIADWSRSYQVGVEMFRKAPTSSARRNTFQNIEADLSTAVKAISNMRASLHSDLLMLSSTDLPELIPSDLELLTGSGFLHHDPNLPGLYTVELGFLESLIEIVRFRAKAMKDFHTQRKLEGNNAPPLKRMDLRVLVSNIENYWREKTKRGFYPEFSNSSSDYSGHAPTNDPSRFAFEVAKRIDKFITAATLERAMKDKF